MQGWFASSKHPNIQTAAAVGVGRGAEPGDRDPPALGIIEPLLGLLCALLGFETSKQARLRWL